MRPIAFKIEKEFPGTSSNFLGRAGVLSTPHGQINTPAYMAVATKATVKGISSQTLPNLSVQGIIANTYHLFLSPGEKIVEKAGGVGKFMNWSGPTMTDSGGFQVFSLGVGFGKKISKFLPAEEDPTRRSRAPVHLSGEEDLLKPTVWDEDLATSHGKLAVVDEEGVSFTSHLDGALHRFTPERSIEIQHGLGADIIYAFDECTAPNAEYDYQKEAMDRTHRWAKRSLTAHRGNVDKNNEQGIYGIVQGGRFENLRIESAKDLSNMDFDGYGIGGSFSKFDLLGILDKVNTELPKEKPRHLLGIGEPEDIFIGIAAGIDTFDCVLPTRNGRTGGLYTHQGKIQIPNAEFKEDFSPIDKDCMCPVCAPDLKTGKHFSRSYIHHLFRTGEMLGPMLASEHNLFFLANLTERIRLSILDGQFEKFRDTFLSKYRLTTQ